MLTIAIATVIAIAIAIILKKMRVDEDSISGITETIFSIGIILGLFGTISGYKEGVFLEQIEVISMQKCGDYKYTYTYATPRILSEDEENVIEYITKTIIGKNIKIIEDPYCTTPVLEIYLKKANKSLWTFGLLGEKKEYIFYIPQRTN